MRFSKGHLCPAEGLTLGQIPQLRRRSRIIEEQEVEEGEMS